MKRYYRIEHKNQPRYVIEDGGDWTLVEGDLFGAHTTGERVERAGARVLAPVHPSKIVCVGLNYKDHAAEQNKPLPKEPMIFLKPSTAVINPGDEIVIPSGVGRVDHEAECGIVIGKRASHVKEQDAHQYIFGITCVNDVTARELQAKDIQYTRAKGFDTFAPLGPCIATGLDYDRPDGLRVEGWVNDERRQNSSTKELIFKIPKLVEFISAVMTLLPGDVIATGTPSGIGPLKSGDRVKIVVEGVGELVNTCSVRL
jgi:2-keto-4-pentenoate hydratase/2-oxohepta-3-ene-1,7-dioic acid hydratase in catechol pathway